MPLISRDLRLKPGISVMEIGCGTGYLTRILAKGLKGKGKVVGVDITLQVLNAAKELVKYEGLSKMIEFVRGNAYDLPLKSESADLVVCQSLLNNLDNPLRALKEMARVARRGGTVGAIESDDDSKIYYDPIDERGNELAGLQKKAVADGAKLVSNHDRRIGRKLPSLLRMIGMSDVQAQGYVWMDPTYDSDLSSRQKRDYYKTDLELKTTMQQNDLQRRKWMLAGGLSEDITKECDKLSFNNLEKLASELAEFDGETAVKAEMAFVVTGRKPSESRATRSPSTGSGL